jgi:hypothetical protein
MLLRRACDLTVPAIEWLWPGYLAAGSIAILDGDPGLGKSLITLDLAARLSTGRTWPDGAASTGPAPVALLFEEDPEAVVVPRLQALGADMTCVYLWPRLEEPGLPHFPSDIQRLDQELGASGSKLAIIDPIMAFLDPTVMANTDANVRRALGPLAKVAEKHRCVILLVRHLNKENAPNALYRGGGSIAFIAACRLAWLVGHDPQMEETLILAQTKNNFAARQPSLAYSLATNALRVDWQGVSRWKADDLAVYHPMPERRRARDFLRLFLEAGPRTARAIRAAAKENGVSEASLRRAKKDLKITPVRVYDGGVRNHYWLMPGQQVPDGPASDTPELDDWLRRWRELWPDKPAEEGSNDENIVA